jgi:4-oxalocrotonate tautomerase
MPFVTIKLTGSILTHQQLFWLQTQTRDLMVNVLHKNHDLTAILVEQFSSSGWSVGNTGVGIGAYLEAKITAGTNTREEKREFLGRAHAMLLEVLGPKLHPVTYLVIDEIAADAWGYGGRSQYDRAHPDESNTLN